MDKDKLNELLAAVQRGDLTVAQAAVQIEDAPGPLTFANLDHNRTLRTGVPEVVFCQGKTPDQVVEIMGQILRHEGRALATRAAPDVAEAVLRQFPEARYNARARIIALGEQATPAHDGPYVAVASGGTSDIPVADEAALTLEFLGDRVQRVYDVGVAGIHRLLRKQEVLRDARVVIAIAGMEGALASVVGGLVSSPVIAVPTSIGYGASFGGLAALLAMLNSCSPGVVVVNIDNGFGAAIHAHKILAG